MTPTPDTVDEDEACRESCQVGAAAQQSLGAPGTVPQDLTAEELKSMLGEVVQGTAQLAPRRCAAGSSEAPPPCAPPLLGLSK